MNRLLSRIAFILVLAGLVYANAQLRGQDKGQEKGQQQEPTQAQKDFEGILKQLHKTKAEAGEAAQKAKTDAERQKILEDVVKKFKGFIPQLLELAEKHPRDEAAFHALCVLLVNTDEQKDLEKVLDLIFKDHQQQLGEFVRVMLSNASPNSERFLTEAKTKAKIRPVAAAATFALGQMKKNTAENMEPGSKEVDKLNKEAESYFDEVVSKHADLKDMAEAARRELYEMRNLAIGKVAPDIEGEDSDGKKFKLSDYKGKVVVLDFWATWCGPCMAMVPHERELVKRLENKPFVLVGVNADETRKRLKDAETEHKIGWRSFYDGNGGTISGSWNVRALPTIYILDHKGVIRHKFVGGIQDEMDKAVDALLKEVGS